MIVRTIKKGDTYEVELSQGNQFFTLHYPGPVTEEEAKWMAKMFRKALSNHNLEVIFKYKNKTK